MSAPGQVQGWENFAEGQRTHAPLIFNHVSYLDALVLATYFAPCGVAKVGVTITRLPASSSAFYLGSSSSKDEVKPRPGCLTCQRPQLRRKTTVTLLSNHHETVRCILLAQADVATMPLVGTITRGLQFLFVARSGTTGGASSRSHHRYSILQVWNMELCASAARTKPFLFAADKENEYTITGDLREQVAAREVRRPSLDSWHGAHSHLLIGLPRRIMSSSFGQGMSDMGRGVVFDDTSQFVRASLAGIVSMIQYVSGLWLQVDPQYPSFMIAAEGTTKPRHCLMRFSVGGFAPGELMQTVGSKARKQSQPRRLAICQTRLLRCAGDDDTRQHLLRDNPTPQLPLEGCSGSISWSPLMSPGNRSFVRISESRQGCRCSQCCWTTAQTGA